MTMNKLIQLITTYILVIVVTGCSTHARKALSMSDFTEITGTTDAAFIRDYNWIKFDVVNYVDEEKIETVTCKRFNSNKNLDSLTKYNLVKPKLACDQNKDTDSADVLKVVIERKTGCGFIKCLDTEVSMIDSKGNIYSKANMETVGAIQLMDYAVGQVINVVIMDALQNSKEDVTWIANFKEYCTDNEDSSECNIKQ